MRALLALLSVIAMFVASSGDATGGAAETDPPLPPNITIVAPADDVSPAHVLFSGMWRAKWDGVLDHILVVEEVDTKGATVVYATGIAPEWGINKGGVR